MSISSNGQINYEGYKFVEVKGKVQALLTKEQK
jgi:hypothetical protein